MYRIEMVPMRRTAISSFVNAKRTTRLNLFFPTCFAMMIFCMASSSKKKAQPPLNALGSRALVLQEDLKKERSFLRPL